MPKLRERLLTSSAAELGLSPLGETRRVWAVLMEMGYPDAVVTLVALADGTTSLYFSSGGGVIGAGAHETVQVANDAFLSMADGITGGLTPTVQTPMPEPGQVCFYVRTPEGTLTGGGNEQAMGEGRHELSRLFYAGHQVITAIREASPS